MRPLPPWLPTQRRCLTGHFQGLLLHIPSMVLTFPAPPPPPPPHPQNNKDYFDQGLDEVKLLQYVNAADPQDEAGLLRLHDFFYFKVRRGGRLGVGEVVAPGACTADGRHRLLH